MRHSKIIDFKISDKQSNIHFPIVNFKNDKMKFLIVISQATFKAKPKHSSKLKQLLDKNIFPEGRLHKYRTYDAAEMNFFKQPRLPWLPFDLF